MSEVTPRDPFKSPATKRQKILLGRASLGWLAVVYSTPIIGVIYGDQLLSFPLTIPLLLGADVAVVGAVAAVNYYVYSTIISKNDTTSLDNETVLEHDLKEQRKMRRAAIYSVLVEVLFLYLGYNNFFMSSLDMGQSNLLMYLMMWIPFNIFNVLLQPLVRLHVFNCKAEGLLERPFWKPPTLGARWRRWRAKRRGDAPTVDAEAAPLLAGDEKAPVAESESEYADEKA